MSAPAFVIHDLEQALEVARVAGETGVEFILQSAKGAGAYMGPDIFAAILDETRRTCPDANITGILDCADEAGTVLKALRSGVSRISVDLSGPALEKINDIAIQQNAVISDYNTDAVDLLDVTDLNETIRQHLKDRKAL